MRVISVSAVISAVFILWAAVCQAAPVMELSTDVWDFGEVYQWTNPSITVSIFNKGDEPLEIKDVKSSCGCTPTFLSDKTIKPGDKGFLKIDFSSYLSTGPVRKMVRLTTNDPAHKVKDIRVIGNVSDKKAAFGSLEQDTVDLGIVAPYETRYFELLIHNNGNKPLVITGVDLPEGFFMDSGRPDRISERKEQAVRIGYRPVKNKGLIYDTVGFEAPDNIGQPLKVRVVGYIGEASSGADSIVMTPTGFGIAPDKPSSLRIDLKNSGQSGVTVESIDSSLDIEQVKDYNPLIVPGETDGLSLTVNPAGMKPGSKGYIYIRLGIPVTVGGGR